MASVREKILDAAGRNTEILSALRETDSSAAKLAQQVAYLQDLNSQLSKTQARVSELKHKTEIELKDHKKYSESTFRRFAHKASGRKDKFEEKAAKEEREYFEAIQAQKTSEDQLAYIKQLKAEAEVAKEKYERDTRRHENLQRELNALYNSIFAGPSPGFPEEDEKESICVAATQHCTQISTVLEREKHVLFLLGQCSAKLRDALQHLTDAYSMSGIDLFGGSTWASLSKRNSLERAESAVSAIRMLQNQIKAIQPETSSDLGTINIHIGDFWTDVVFDNIWTDMMMHEKIKEAESQLMRVAHKLVEQVKKADKRIKDVEADQKIAGQRLEIARLELQNTREQAFARVAVGEQFPRTETAPPHYPIDEPPPYSP